jgi:hypothetical protein
MKSVFSERSVAVAQDLVAAWLARVNVESVFCRRNLYDAGMDNMRMQDSRRWDDSASSLVHLGVFRSSV